MQKVYFFCLLLLGFFSANAQLVFNEGFNSYTEGNLGTQGLWQQNGAGNDVQVASAAPLTYTTYGSGARYINVASVNGTDPHKLFSTDIPTGSGRFIYLSFLTRVTNAEERNQDPDFTVVLRNTADTDIPLRFYVGEDMGSSDDIEFGISIGGNTAIAYTAGNFQYNTTYLIVIRYEIYPSPGPSFPINDDAYLYVNPASFPLEPTGTPAPAVGANVQNGTEVDFGSLLNALQIFQTDDLNSPDASYDGFKVAHGATSAEAWSNLNPTQAPLPVLMKSFKAQKDNNSVKVLWEVGTEDNVKGYEIQRSQDGSHFEPIGFVDAAAKTSYSFIDTRPLPGANFYRVLTIDNDRRLKYSSIVSVNGRTDFYISRFPNPTTNKLIVQHQEVSSPAILRITGLDGRIIKQYRPPLYSVQTDIDVSNLRAGNYVLEFVNEGKRVSVTFTKQ